MFYAVVAIEEGIVTLEDDNQNTWYLPLTQFSIHIQEGDVLVKQAENYRVDEVETKRRKTELEELLQKIRNKAK